MQLFLQEVTVLKGEEQAEMAAGNAVVLIDVPVYAWNGRTLYAGAGCCSDGASIQGP
jgi:hypothetical protein